ncbi:hypothetical protein [Haloarcula sp. Atlit-47R]|nr:MULTISPECIES: hypothetical protein [Haloarcula]
MAETDCPTDNADDDQPESAVAGLDTTRHRSYWSDAASGSEQPDVLT